MKILEENEEEAPLQEQEIPAEAPSPNKKDLRAEDPSRPIARKEGTTNSKGSVTHSRAKSSFEETLENSNEEQEPQSRKGRNSNKTLREQEAAREKVAGNQTILDFMVKNS